MQILGEKLVLAAHSKSRLATVALRPSGIFGEGDPLLVPTIVAKAKQGKMGVIIGSGQNLMDFTYVGNVAQAHLQVCFNQLVLHMACLSQFCMCRIGPSGKPAAWLPSTENRLRVMLLYSSRWSLCRSAALYPFRRFQDSRHVLSWLMLMRVLAQWPGEAEKVL